MTALAESADEVLMSMVKASADRTAADVLIRRHKEHAFRIAMQLTGDRDDALDASQEAFVKVFTRAARYQDGRPFWPWFLAILRNSARSLQRAPWRRRAVRAESLIDYVVDPGADPHTQALAAELWQRVLALPLKLREVMVLRHMEGLDYKQIAEVLGVPTNTVATRIYQARSKLAAQDEL
jgi:RNA polymerase sigma-70 factor (ECF subfamily)